MEEINFSNQLEQELNKENEIEKFEQTSNLNESNHVLDDNLDTVSKQNDYEDSLVGNKEDDARFKINKLISKNENFKEIFMLLDNKTKSKPIINNNIDFSLNSKQNSILNINTLKRTKEKINPKMLKGKLSIMYGEITNLAQRTHCSKSLGPYPKNQIKTSRNITFLQKGQKINSKIALSSNKESNTKPRIAKDLFSFNLSSKKEKIRRLGIDDWIGKERNNNQDNFFIEKKTELKSLLSYVSYFPKSKEFSNLKNSYLSNKKNITYDSYTNNFYENELNKFSSRLNNSTSKLTNMKNTAKHTSLSISSFGLSPFYCTRRINLQKKGNKKLFL